MSRRAVRPLLLTALLVIAWLVSHAVFAELDVVWLSLMPVFAIVLPLVAGRYVGEQAIGRLAAGRRPAAPRTDAALPVPRRLCAHHGHGGLLLARRLAGRAPPRCSPAV
jgi:hypothetical protein